jgi:hypothetical protein
LLRRLEAQARTAGRTAGETPSAERGGQLVARHNCRAGPEPGVLCCAGV